MDMIRDLVNLMPDESYIPFIVFFIVFMGASGLFLVGINYLIQRILRKE